MEMTAKGIPVSLRPYFQEYNLDDLDPTQDAFTIIKRTMARGNRMELHWLFSCYGEEQLARWVQEAGWRSLPRRRLLFWQAYFDLGNMPERAGIWPH
ncbi:MAG: hypothetical protein BroJett015_12390 [Chloroflexota bacterium]|nr:hypothetical protein [Ardenticatenaceae bacterium]GIK55576.1 MAG: hypothetical protein BroJett015_12390 [Chloroflexota bacterium]